MKLLDMVASITLDTVWCPITKIKTLHTLTYPSYNSLRLAISQCRTAPIKETLHALTSPWYNSLFTLDTIHFECPSANGAHLASSILCVVPLPVRTLRSPSSINDAGRDVYTQMPNKMPNRIRNKMASPTPTLPQTQYDPSYSLPMPDIRRGPTMPHTPHTDPPTLAVHRAEALSASYLSINI